MNESVLIEMTTTQVVDGQTDVSTATYRGRCSISDDVATLRYAVKDENGSVITKLELREDGCFLENTGNFIRRMEFIPGRRTTSRMQLPMGLLEMTVDTHTYDLQVTTEDPKHMRITLQYDLYTDSALMAENELEIKVVVQT